MTSSERRSVATSTALRLGFRAVPLPHATPALGSKDLIGLPSGDIPAYWPQGRLSPLLPITVQRIALQHHIASALNQLLASSLRVEIDEVSTSVGTGLANLSALAREIQLLLDGLEGAAPERLAQPHVWEDGAFRVVWHARRRRNGEEAKPVIVA